MRRNTVVLAAAGVLIAAGVVLVATASGEKSRQTSRQEPVAAAPISAPVTPAPVSPSIDKIRSVLVSSDRRSVILAAPEDCGVKPRLRQRFSSHAVALTLLTPAGYTYGGISLIGVLEELRAPAAAAFTYTPNEKSLAPLNVEEASAATAKITQTPQPRSRYVRLRLGRGAVFVSGGSQDGGGQVYRRAVIFQDGNLDVALVSIITRAEQHVASLGQLERIANADF